MKPDNDRRKIIIVVWVFYTIPNYITYAMCIDTLVVKDTSIEAMTSGRTDAKERLYYDTWY